MKIGVIGLGSIGMRHAKNLQAMGHIVQGYDPIPERRSLFPGALGEDAYVIASPTKDHHSHLANCYIKWNKPVFIEKPLSDHGVGPSLASSVKMVGYNLRFHGCVKKAREWLPKIGRPLWAQFTCAQYNEKPAYKRDGVILNWSHEIDLALHLLGPAHLETSSTRVVDGCDDMTTILMSHENGCRSTIHLDYVTKPEQRYFMIQGEKGKINAVLTTRNIFLSTEDKTYSDWMRCPGSYDTDYEDEMKAFVQVAQGLVVKDDYCTGEQALKVLEICLQVREQAGL